ncbi:unnamed protein product [Vitrella brassicaformis CCMP3155]|uniref:BTB domain-containing protein n=1 Tax=Vitrella brassicaformis (strain CCMP3155) TaxID=1169540 RepID=A0A0G4FI89_VITBC|nr:unnamed protein product [Vitrella brassicaformis CCMP3155]|eukprot:CEM13140.1 unnamed protein product [Vitrella brassicaformis CCMP3155]
MMGEASLVKIVVGSGDVKKTFDQKKDLLVKYSPYFAAALDGHGFAESSTQSVEVPAIQPETFRHMGWLLESGEVGNPEVLKAQVAGMMRLPYALHVPSDDTQSGGAAQGAAAASEGPPQKKHKAAGTTVYSGLLSLLAMCQYFQMEAHVAAILEALYSCAGEWTIAMAVFILDLNPGVLESQDFPKQKMVESVAREVVEGNWETWSPLLKRLPIDITMRVVQCIAQAVKGTTDYNPYHRRWAVNPYHRCGATWLNNE